MRPTWEVVLMRQGDLRAGDVWRTPAERWSRFENPWYETTLRVVEDDGSLTLHFYAPQERTPSRISRVLPYELVEVQRRVRR